MKQNQREAPQKQNTKANVTMKLTCRKSKGKSMRNQKKKNKKHAKKAKIYPKSKESTHRKLMQKQKQGPQNMKAMTKTSKKPRRN